MKKACNWPGCGELTDGGRCSKHRAKVSQEVDARRGTAAARGYGARWQRVRAAYLKAHPLCVKCLELGTMKAASEVDHIIPHCGDQVLMWEEKNFQSLCKSHHSAKTAEEDGRWRRNLV